MSTTRQPLLGDKVTVNTPSRSYNGEVTSVLYLDEHVVVVSNLDDPSELPARFFVDAPVLTWRKRVGDRLMFQESPNKWRPERVTEVLGNGFIILSGNPNVPVPYLEDSRFIRWSEEPTVAAPKAAPNTPITPCPFCGGTDLSFPVSCVGDSPDDNWWYVECQDCTTMGPGAETPTEALTLWNDRHTTPITLKENS